MDTETNPTPNETSNLGIPNETPVTNMDLSTTVETAPPVPSDEHSDQSSAQAQSIDIQPTPTPETTEPPVVLVGHDYDNAPVNTTETIAPVDTQPTPTPETTEPPVVLVGHDYDNGTSTTHATTEQPEPILPATGNDHIQKVSVLATIFIMVGAGLSRLRHPKHS